LLIHDRGTNRFLYYLQPFAPYDLSRWHEDIALEWARCGNERGAREVGKRFFFDQRAGLEQNWLSFTSDQKRDLVPLMDPNKKIVTYFSSSDDEFACVGDAFKFDVWKSQLDAVHELIRICREDKNIQLFIRIHPHLKKKSKEEQLRWLALGDLQGVNIVSFDSDVDTYALVERSDVVVTAGSTVGIEAVFWGRPSICLGPSYYSELGATLHPKSAAELKDMIASNALTADPERAIPYGYYMATYGRKFIYYVPETLFKGTFLGVDIHGVSGKRLKWLRFRQVATKPYRVLTKLLNC